MTRSWPLSKGAQDFDADRTDLTGQPGLVIGADRMVVGDGGPGVDHRVRGSSLGRAPLRDRVARYMVPRSIDFIDAMPRLPTGKLYKRLLKQRYAGARPTA